MIANSLQSYPELQRGPGNLWKTKLEYKTPTVARWWEFKQYYSSLENLQNENRMARHAVFGLHTSLPHTIQTVVNRQITQDQ